MTPGPAHSGKLAGGGGTCQQCSPATPGVWVGSVGGRAAPTPRLVDALTGGGARATSTPRDRRGGAWGGGPG